MGCGAVSASAPGALAFGPHVGGWAVGAAAVCGHDRDRAPSGSDPTARSGRLRPRASVPPSAGGGQQRRQRPLDSVGDDVDVGQRVIVAEQPVVEVAVVGHDRDRERVVRGKNATGNRSWSWRPSTYNGTCGPGTLVTRRLNSRVEKFRRLAWARIVGGARLLTATSVAAPTACFDCFSPSIAAAHVPQPRDRIVDVDRERTAHRRQLVAERAALITRPDRDRHQRPHLQSLGADTARPQPAGHRP